MTARILVTGAGGFIGKECVDHLRSTGAELHLAGRSRLNLLDHDAVTNLIKQVRPTHLLHLAWITTHGEYWTSSENLDWVSASLHLMRQFAEAGGHRAVVAGTCAEYDWSEGTLSERTTPLRPQKLYGRSKHALHEILESFCAQNGVSLGWARLFFLYGPAENERRFVPSLIRALLDGRSAEVRHGDFVRDFLHCRDAGAALGSFLLGRTEGAVNIGSGVGTRLAEVAETLGRLTGRSDLVRIQQNVPPESEPMALIADVQRLREEVHWKPSISLAAGLEDALKWWQRREAS